MTIILNGKKRTLLFCGCLLLTLFAAFGLFAQTNTTIILTNAITGIVTSNGIPVSTNHVAGTGAIPIPPSDFFHALWGLLTVVLLGLTAWLNGRVKTERSTAEAERSKVETERLEVEKITRRLSGPRFELPKSYSEKINTVLLLGIGGVGKTSIIRKLTGHEKANPRIKSSGFDIYSLVHEVSTDTTSEIRRIDINDYNGQNQGQLISELTERSSQGKQYPITSIVFVVDIFWPPERPGEQQKTQATWDKKRVKRNLEQWGDVAIQQCFGFCKGKPAYVCLFINKADLLDNWNLAVEDEIRDAYKPLIERFFPHISGVLFEVIVGSAGNDEERNRRDIFDMRICTLLQDLVKTAKPLK